MRQWKTHINNGNQFFNTLKLNEAEQEYNLALSRATLLYPSWFRAENAVAALVVSYVNLSHVYLKQNDSERSLSVVDDISIQLNLSLLAKNVSTDRVNAIKEALIWLGKKQQYIQGLILSGSDADECQCCRCRSDRGHGSV